MRPDRLKSSTSTGSKDSASASSSNNMEPENDAGAQPLRGNIVRKPSIIASMAEASGMPYASVALVGSVSTDKTMETSYEQSVGSRNNNSVSNNNISTLEAHRRTSQQAKKFPPVSRSSKLSFAGNIISSSKVRRTSSMDPDPDEDEKGPGRISTSARISSTEFSINFADLSSRDTSIVAEVVDEAQIEAEFEERVRSRMVEAVEIRLTNADEENPPNNTSKNNKTSSSVHSSSQSHRSNNSSHHNIAPDGDGQSGTQEQAPGKKAATARDLARLRQRSRTIRCIVAWICFFVVSAIFIVLLVVFLRLPNIDTSADRGASLFENPIIYDDAAVDESADPALFSDNNVTNSEFLTVTDIDLIINDD